MNKIINSTIIGYIKAHNYFTVCRYEYQDGTVKYSGIYFLPGNEYQSDYDGEMTPIFDSLEELEVFCAGQIQNYL